MPLKQKYSKICRHVRDTRGAWLALLLAGLFLAGQQAQAADTGFYAGYSLGRSDADGDSDPIVAQLRSRGWAVTDAQLDLGDTGWRALAGLRFTDYLGVEFGWIDLGEAVNTLETTETNTAAFFDDLVALGPVMPRGWTLAGTFELPLGRFGETKPGGFGDRTWLRAKAGLVDLDSDVITSLGKVGEFNDTEVFFGFGVGLDATRRTSLVLEWERYQLENEVSYWSASLHVRF